MKNLKITKFRALLFFSFIFNTYIFLINYLNYNSTRGTDFNKYGPYLIFIPMGWSHFARTRCWIFLVYLLYIKLKINSLKISPNFESLIHNFGIQVGNYFFYNRVYWDLFFIKVLRNITNNIVIGFKYAGYIPPLLDTINT